jgi:hypothetical protein
LANFPSGPNFDGEEFAEASAFGSPRNGDAFSSETNGEERILAAIT